MANRQSMESGTPMCRGNAELCSQQRERTCNAKEVRGAQSCSKVVRGIVTRSVGHSPDLLEASCTGWRTLLSTSRKDARYVHVLPWVALCR